MFAFLGTVDAALTDVLDQITGYFSENLPVVIAAVLSIVLVLWFIGMAFRATGSKKKNL